MNKLYAAMLAVTFACGPAFAGDEGNSSSSRSQMDQISPNREALPTGRYGGPRPQADESVSPNQSRQPDMDAPRDQDRGYGQRQRDRDQPSQNQDRGYQSDEGQDDSTQNSR